VSIYAQRHFIGVLLEQDRAKRNTDSG